MNKPDNTITNAAPVASNVATPLVIIVRPSSLTGRGQRYDALFNGRPICNSLTPFYSAARKLIEQGHDPHSLLVMRHEGLDMDCLRQRLGYAAKLAVREDAKRGPYGEVYKPFTG